MDDLAIDKIGYAVYNITKALFGDEKTMDKEIYNGNLSDVYNPKTNKFLTVISCGVHMDSKHVTVREIGRSDWHLLYVESGEMLATIDGVCETVSEGDFVIYPPGKPQRYEQRGGVCYWAHFSGINVREILKDAGLYDRVLFRAERVLRSVPRIFERMIYRYATNLKLRELSLSADLVSLLAELGKAADGETSAKVDDRLYPVIVHMNKHCFEEADLDLYAGMVGASRGRFMHIFKEAMGVSAYSYVLDLRIGKAAELLLSDEMSIAQVSYETGFSDPLYFSRIFRKRCGLSPEMFRSTADRGAFRNIPGGVHRQSGCE